MFVSFRTLRKSFLLAFTSLKDIVPWKKWFVEDESLGYYMKSDFCISACMNSSLVLDVAFLILIRQKPVVCSAARIRTRLLDVLYIGYRCACH